MKIFFLLFCMALLCSCDDKENDISTSDPFLESMAGRYVLKQMYADTAIDLNFDGSYNSNMMEEMDCQVFYPLQLYDASVEYNQNVGSVVELMFEMSNSQVYSETAPMQQCFFNDILLYSNMTVDKQTGEITITQHSSPEREAQYGALTHARFKGHKLYLDVNKIIFTSGGWQTLPMHFVYEWNNS